MIDRNEEDSGPCVFVAGPGFLDAAEIVGNWLRACASLNKHWKECCQDQEFARSVETLRLIFEPDFSIMAMGIVTQLRYEGGRSYQPVVIPLSSEDVEMFAVMVRVGLFVQRSRRYEMAVPHTITIQSVKDAARYLASTWEEEYGLHPEYFVEVISGSEARTWRMPRYARIWQKDCTVIIGNSKFGLSSTPRPTA